MVLAMILPYQQSFARHYSNKNGCRDITLLSGIIPTYEQYTPTILPKRYYFDYGGDGGNNGGHQFGGFAQNKMAANKQWEISPKWLQITRHDNV